MEEEPVSTIRETSRNLLKLSRRFHRDEETDIRRSVTSVCITSENIEEIANKLKTKSSVSVSELQILKNGIIEDSKYIQLVLNTHGALRGLVRELTGKEVRKQCVAAGCFCNLGLGDSKAGGTVSKAAGMYLVAALDSLSTELAVTCAWAVGNLAGSGPKAAALLAAQGAVTKLSDMAATKHEEATDAALYALVHFGYQMKDELSPEHLTKILESVSKISLTVAYSQLLFILSCHQHFNSVLPESLLNRIILEFPISIQSHTNCINICSKDCKLLFLVRTLGNVTLNDSIYELFVNSFVPNIETFKLLLLKEDTVSKSLLWLLGNLFNYCSDSPFFGELLR